MNSVPDHSSSLLHLRALLESGNEMYAHDLRLNALNPPTIRLVKPGTFREFREWKVGKAGKGTGMQVKVPAVVFDRGTVKWLEERVIEEVKAEANVRDLE